ncbi:DUF4405 domain-containing protein [Spirosoma sordidisoli]|uniref:DUF4405 domain-containing protein n=1 Tax=Spirosoma sordidisoli TaxID=2502893 RepID=A0A4Q2UKR9_9BACT|nr:DUF4405 domain-containing protein [Spirosoma sordidisoli]RYC69272.1 DUF4405 domain-containing protein [Spirosoma sordidisoli]
MKSKNLVSLSVAAVFAVLSVTGLLIYLGQGNHTIDHTHAWFGVLFFGAAVFHIINNWSSIKGYSVSRRTNSVQRELIIPSLITVVFVVGIAADWPVFKDLANAGKKAFGRGKPKKEALSQTAVDSIARRLIADHDKVDAQSIRFDTTAVLGENVIVAQGTASHAKPDTTTFRFTDVLSLEGNQWKVVAGQTGPR